MNVTVPIYQRRRGALYDWSTLGLGAFTRRRNGTQPAKLHQQIVDDLRRAADAADPGALFAFDLKKGTHLRRVRVELTIDDGGRKRRVSGLAPLVIEPRPAGGDRVLTAAYHPHRQDEWFPVDASWPLEDQASLWFGQAWAELKVDDVDELWSDGKDLVRALGFSLSPRGLLDAVAGKRKGLWDDLRADPTQKGKPKRQGMKVLPGVGVDRTARRSAAEAEAASPRSPWREQLQMLLGGRNKRSTIVVGPPGSGKSALVERLVDDLLEIDDFASHRNLDRVTHVWEVTGKRIIAGMIYVGDWEQRVTDLLEDVRGKRVVLYVPDLHAFGRIGQARDSSRALADVFRGPVARGEAVLLGECTEAELARLEQDAPAFASLFARVPVREATTDETFRMLLEAARSIEAESQIEFEPMALRTVLELGSSLLSHRAQPGRALELLRQLADRARQLDEPTVIDPAWVIEHLAARTGLPPELLRADQPLLAADVERRLGARVIGQPGPVGLAAELVLKIRAGLVDPRRPYAVYLFTGPTGTGKTELAKALAAYLYGSEARLVRFDMGEFGSPDAPARLIGDRYQPDGLLTRAAHEQPFSVVLFDEVEKAHPSVLNLFLQLFDEGRLTDAAGATASFTHAVIVLTSNLGARPSAPVGFGDQAEAVMADVARAVRDFFPPELFNRIDAVVPFAPLSRESAAGVAQKELDKLLSRRGVRGRHIFVRANRAVVDRVVAEAFEQRDGARSLKRFLEDRIGSLVGEEIAKAPGAALRVLHIFAQRDPASPFRVEQDALVEVASAPLRSALEPLLDLGAEALAPHLHASLDVLDEAERAPELAALAGRIRAAMSALATGRRDEADALFRLDGLRGLVRSLRERVELMLISSRELDRQALDRQIFRRDTVEYGSKFTWTRRHLRVLSSAEVLPDLRARTQRAMLEALAEVAFLRRALAAADDPARHAVSLELAPLEPGPPHAAQLLRPLAEAYLALLAPPGGQRRGELDGWSLAREDGALERGGDAAGLRAALARDAGPGREVAQVAIRAAGMCLFDLFEGEAGTHVLYDPAHAPALVGVRALPADAAGAATAGALTEAFVAARAEYARALAGEGAPGRRPALPPLVRALRRETRAGPAPFAIEDYGIGYADTVWARGLGEALAPIFLLRLSREAGPP
ncbi:MAG TPA: AAA family ATPase [Polyangiaceae bacterium]|nr:AAA family ATPase [Polyangiaceae bacterium]